ncbi:iron chelate uptake ABC transporter family permease subunit [Aliamphritea spongicola]|nr:iron chelate uptake ABC transporter family permease subunit [Aliamphritea spongicola]
MRLWASLAVIMLTASCVAITGPIAFVGLLIPHLGRNIVGHDYRILLPFCGLLGAGLLSWADLISRYMAFPSETPVGLVTALLGAPCFIWLASCRRSIADEHSKTDVTCHSARAALSWGACRIVSWQPQLQ